MRLKIFALIFVIVWCGIFLSEKINLPTADIGRHIANGEVLAEAPFAEKQALLNTNFFSYTMPDKEFTNHHWASGVIFYFIEKIFGFTGLSIFYTLASLAAIILFWNVARLASNPYIASLLAVILTPLLVSRAEIRPEMWSYLLSGIFLNILYFRKNLWLIPPFMMLWVNLHIGFIFGFLILGSFCVEDFKKFAKIALVSLGLSLVNPFGYKIILYPFLIFKDYGYRIVENQSISFLENISFTEGQHFLLFKIIAGAILISALLMFYRRIKIPISMLAPTLVTGILAYFGIRNFPIFGLFAMVFLSFSFWQLLIPKFSRHAIIAGSIIALIFSLSFGFKNIFSLRPIMGWGLYPESLQAAKFMNKNDIRGPIFNNYDVGGYLIHALYPREKVFVDNRPEAYSKKFFEEIYIPAQEDDTVWHGLDEQYGFNSVVFSHRDYTPWGQKFLRARIMDDKWTPVFADSYIIIFLKRNNLNAELIAKFKIPRSQFGISE